MNIDVNGGLAYDKALELAAQESQKTFLAEKKLHDRNRHSVAANVERNTNELTNICRQTLARPNQASAQTAIQALPQVVVRQPQQQARAQVPSPSSVSASQPVSVIRPPRNVPAYTHSNSRVQEGRRFAQVGFLRYQNKNLSKDESISCLEYLFNTKNKQEMQERYKAFIHRPIGQMGLFDIDNDFLRNPLGLDLSFMQRAAATLLRSSTSSTSLLPGAAINILNKLKERAGISLSA